MSQDDHNNQPPRLTRYSTEQPSDESLRAALWRNVPGAAPQRPKSGRIRWLVLSLAALLLMGGGAWLLWGRPSQTTLSPFVRLAEWRPVIDAGHGGEDGGANSLTGVREAEINLQISEKTQWLMLFYGVPAVMTRESDISLHDASASTLREKKVSDLKNRTALVNGVDRAVLLSIHQNSFDQAKYYGLQAFYGQKQGSRELAELLQDLVAQSVDPTNTRAAKAVADSIYLMNNVTVPAVLVECGFLTNPAEERKLREDPYQRKLAAAITAAFLRWEDAQRETAVTTPA